MLRKSTSAASKPLPEMPNDELDRLEILFRDCDANGDGTIVSSSIPLPRLPTPTDFHHPTHLDRILTNSSQSSPYLPSRRASGTTCCS